jgi:hypothetical protein
MKKSYYFSIAPLATLAKKKRVRTNNNAWALQPGVKQRDKKKKRM